MRQKRAASTKDDVQPVQTCPSFQGGHLPAKEDVDRLRSLLTPHVESFNYFLNVGLERGIRDIETMELDVVDPKKLARQDTKSEKASFYDNATTVEYWIENVKVAKPVKSAPSGLPIRLYPRECRERRLMYSGAITGTFCYNVVQRRNGIRIPGSTVRLPRSFGNMPIMVMSDRCHLAGKSPAQLVKLREEQTEFGGYFVVSGIERCVRMLQVPRRNYATAIKRSNYANRGSTFTDLGVAMRCSRHNGDQSSITNTVHYLTTGGATLRFVARKQEFLIPVILILRSLSGVSQDGSHASGADAAAGISGWGITDGELYRRIVQGDDDNTFLTARARLILQDARVCFGNLNTPDECLAFIGSRFRRISMKSETTSDIDIGHFIIRKYILIHLQKYKDKLECLLLMLRKLYYFAAGDCGVDNADSLQNQEILLPGHLISTFVKEKFEEFLQALRLGITIEMRKSFAKTTAKLKDSTYWGRLVDRYSGKSSGSIGKKVQHFLSTGNVVSTTGLDLMQVSGFTIVAERLNFLRYISHFRSVHRGQFFMEMRTTAVRKLLPDQWGFICPVHTPDGGPCGLLSHMSLKTHIMAHPASLTGNGLVDLDRLLISLGVAPVGAGREAAEGISDFTHSYLAVSIDGRVIGGATPAACKTISMHLRKLKVEDPPVVPPTLEVALIPPGLAGAPYPGLFLFTGAARLVRPVLQRSSGKVELIGPLEQNFLDVACLDEDIREGITTHQELDPTNMLDLIASLTPFSDHNQSPRNMYQCQMGKQTMGTPCASLPFRPDNKLYRIQTPQAPVVQTANHARYKMDEYPNGTNAVVAVLSYTGFDMEDAMILNKGSYERGFGHATVYKTKVIDLQEENRLAGARSGEGARMRFENKVRLGKFFYKNLDQDGLPSVGDRVEEGDALVCILDTVTGRDKAVRHKEQETAYVEAIRRLSPEGGSGADDKVSITLRVPRNPIIGDKFSSRHGQKGVLSVLWPHEDMPFTEQGVTPDVIINPHAFPSRMTIGMLIESMAGKGGALHGHFQEGTPFTFHESGEKVALDYFGEQLQAAGYNYHGSEALYSGLSGCVMHADLYIGIVYYQRLRHMVSDKYQVRATGPTNALTRQPIKGRKKGGGIRLGEMERDSLLSHGAAFLVRDRLMDCSDRSAGYACSRCGDLLFSTTERNTVQSAGQSAHDAANKPKLRLFCRNPSCLETLVGDDSNDDAVVPITMPYVYRYLANELAAMNIKMKLEIN